MKHSIYERALCMHDYPEISFGTRKALAIHIGEAAGAEIVQMLQRIAADVELLRDNKVDVTRIVPIQRRNEHTLSVLEFETE